MKPGQHHKKLDLEKAQVSLETALALIMLALFLAGGMAVFNSMKQ